ncbi:SusC/RagA family TonB-linked outer membrane protein [uncultured Chryseobacterium sp.]|uniref:SusC/RagA family TonB-linked outer membrane protein n=1 Tax=uncultured Chryseobacterium sp. TaxID=259322 RepID=UPI0025E9CEB5|nr:SusC/RagA family TonB-linked outer membrane protein [uncultured Chryseobacterium sp.]
MKKLTASVLLVVVSSSFALVNAQNRKNDTIIREQSIGEVVITGALGIKKKQDAVTSSNQLVSNKDINQASSPNLADALTSKVAGLQINNTSNSVKPSYSVVLRGNRSLYADNTALVVIDGAISTMNIYQQLPPDAIESINVIKGPAGAALYGSKGSNGVLIVTTKRGTKSNRISFTLTSSLEISSVYKLPKIQSKYGQGIQDTSYDPTDYSGTNWVPYENTSWGPSYTSSLGGQMLQEGLPQADGSFIMSPYTYKKDNIKSFFNNGLALQNGVTMNVGGSDSYANLSINRLENDFMIAGDNLKRNSFVFKAGKKIDKFRIDGSFTFIDENIKQTGANLYGMLLQTPSNIEVSRYRNSGFSGHWTAYAWNPFALRDALRNSSNTTTLTGNLSMGYEFSKNISLTYTGNIITQSQVTENHTDAFTRADAVVWNTPNDPYYDQATIFDLGGTSLNITSSYGKSMTKSWSYYGDLMLNFNYELTDNIGLKFNIGNNIQDRKADFTQIGGTNLRIPRWYNILNVQNSTPWYNLNNGSERERVVAGFANADLSYKDYLFLNATYRIEQSSRLSLRPSYTTGVRQNPLYQYFSTGLSFVGTKAIESLRNNDILSYLKISAAFTRTGSAANAIYSIDEVGVFPTGYPFTAGTSTLNSYLYNSNGVNQYIKPEFNNTLEANISLGFLKDRITLDGSVYQVKTKDMVTRVTYPTSSGLGSMLDNFGNLKNTGFEVTLGLTPFKSTDFEWNLRGSYSKYRSKVESLANGQEQLILANTGTQIPGNIAAVVGYDAPMIIGSAYQRDPEGHIIVDANGLPVVNAKPEILGKVNPDYTISFSTNIRFKQFTLAATGDYRTGNKFVSETKNMLGFTGGSEKTAEFDRSQGYVIPNSVQLVNGQYVTNTTTVMNDPTYHGVTQYFTSNYQTDIAEEFVVDGTALKIRQIALSYSVPKSLLQNTFINTLSVGVFARNPFVWYAKSNRNFADPETANTTGIAAGYQAISQLPTSRSFGFNVNINF